MQPHFPPQPIIVSNQPVRSDRNRLDCIHPGGASPCLLKPFVKGIPTQRVLSEDLGKQEYRVNLEVQKGAVAYLPCNTRYEIKNEVWLIRGIRCLYIHIIKLFARYLQTNSKLISYMRQQHGGHLPLLLWFS